jgi:uncharacterized alpha-E superfamily protein
MLQSRVADSLYWIARYLERAGHTIRLIDVRLDLELDRRANEEGWDFTRLCAAVNCEVKPEAQTSPSRLVDSLVFDVSNRGSVLACITAARDNARQAREEISSDMWEQLNALYLRLKQVRGEGTWSVRPHYLSRLVIEGVHLFEGVTDATMGHGEGWQFLRAGRFIERAAVTATLVDQQFKDVPRLPANHVQWVGLLRSCAAFEAYVRCYTADVRPDRVAEFLLLNAEFPRSVRFAAARVESALRAIAQLTGRGSGGRAERLAGRLHASLDYGQVDEILAEDPHAYLEGIVRYCAQIHDAAQQSYISYPVEFALPA